MDLDFVTVYLTVPAPVRRQPTDFLPNSPSTSAGSTRTQFSAKTSNPSAAPNEAELMATRHPIISLFYQAHEGVPGDSPYSVKTKQLVSTVLDTSRYIFLPISIRWLVVKQCWSMGYMSFLTLSFNFLITIITIRWLVAVLHWPLVFFISVRWYQPGEWPM